MSLTAGENMAQPNDYQPNMDYHKLKNMLKKYILSTSISC